MRARSILLSSILAIGGLAGCDKRPNEWNAYVYPRGISGDHFIVRGFATYQACETASHQLLGWMNQQHGTSEFECGYKCGPLNGEVDLDICKETQASK